MCKRLQPPPCFQFQPAMRQTIWCSIQTWVQGLLGPDITHTSAVVVPAVGCTEASPADSSLLWNSEDGYQHQRTIAWLIRTDDV